MSIALPIEKQAGMAVMRKMVRVKARINVKQRADEYQYDLNGMLWLDLGGVEAEPFRFKGYAYKASDGQYYVQEFAPMQGALSGGAKGLASFYEKALQELINENPQLIG